jgi:hypothetical protein
MVLADQQHEIHQVYDFRKAKRLTGDLERLTKPFDEF